MAEALTPAIIVLALGAGALGFPDALRLLLRDVAGKRSPALDIAVCAVAMAALTAYALGAVLLARFVRKPGPSAGAGGRAPAPRARCTDPFTRLTLAVSVGAAAAVFVYLVAEPGARGLAFLCRRILDDVAGEIPVVSVLVASAAAVLLACTAWWRPLLRTFRVHGAAPASTPTARLSDTAQSAAAVFLLLLVLVSGGLYARRAAGSLVGVGVSVAVAAAAVGAPMVLSRFTRSAAGGRAALTPATNTRRFEAPSQLAVVVSFASLVCLLLLLVVTAA